MHRSHTIKIFEVTQPPTFLYSEPVSMALVSWYVVSSHSTFQNQPKNKEEANSRAPWVMLS